MPRPSGFRRSRPDSRGKRRNIPISYQTESGRIINEEDVNRSIPADYFGLQRSDFADPDTYRYPVDKQHINAALTYWARPEDRRFYTKEGQDRITEEDCRAGPEGRRRSQLQPGVHGDPPGVGEEAAEGIPLKTGAFLTMMVKSLESADPRDHFRGVA